MHRNMYHNENQASYEHRYYSGKPTDNKDPPMTGIYRPPKSCNVDNYNKSKKVFEKTTQTRFQIQFQIQFHIRFQIQIQIQANCNIQTAMCKLQYAHCNMKTEISKLQYANWNMQTEICKLKL